MLKTLDLMHENGFVIFLEPAANLSFHRANSSLSSSKDYYLNGIIKIPSSIFWEDLNNNYQLLIYSILAGKYWSKLIYPDAGKVYLSRIVWEPIGWALFKGRAHFTSGSEREHFEICALSAPRNLKISPKYIFATRESEIATDDPIAIY